MRQVLGLRNCRMGGTLPPHKQHFSSRHETRKGWHDQKRTQKVSVEGEPEAKFYHMDGSVVAVGEGAGYEMVIIMGEGMGCATRDGGAIRAVACNALSWCQSIGTRKAPSSISIFAVCFGSVVFGCDDDSAWRAYTVQIYDCAVYGQVSGLDLWSAGDIAYPVSGTSDE